MNEGTPIIIKKKKAHGHAHHGGSWKVAYADFVTAMMAFFMVMWIMGLSEETRAQIQGYFNDPMGFMKNLPRSKQVIPSNTPPSSKKGTEGGTEKAKAAAEKRSKDEAAAAEIQREITQAVANQEDPDLKSLLKDVEISINDEGLLIEFVENNGEVFFEVGRAVIRPGAKKLISKIAPVLGKSGRSMIIDGHTDARPYPSPSYDNWNLSSDRANALRRELRADGVAESQILRVRGNAATHLKTPGDPYHFSNRRVTVLLPYSPTEEQLADLPQDSLKAEREAAFRKPESITPSR